MGKDHVDRFLNKMAVTGKQYFEYFFNPSSLSPLFD